MKRVWRTVRFIFLLAGVIASIRVGIAVADNFSGQTGGTTSFASHLVGGVNYILHSICDYTTGASQCATVSASGSLQVDETTTSQFHSDMTAPAPATAATTWNTNTYTTGTTNPMNMDLHGALWQDIGAVGGTALALGQTTMSASVPVAIASNQSAITVTTTNSDPCANSAKTTANFTNTVSGGQIVAGTSAKKTYVCSLALFTSAITNVSLLEGTGSSVCTGSTAATFLNTGTTVANGAYLLAGGGMTYGNGHGTVFVTNTNANNLCVYFDTSNGPRVVASVTYVQQ